MNNAPNPQDCGFGSYLTVPSPLLDFVNVSHPDAHTSDDPYFTDACDSDVSMACESESGSDDDSPMLLTPPSHLYELDDDVMITDGSCLQAQAHATSEFQFRLYDDEDEEDELPPFDDWYLDIAQRASVSC